MPAEKAGMKAGDTIQTINGNTMLGVEDFVEYVKTNKAKPMYVTWKSGSKERSDTITRFIFCWLFPSCR